jgi:hypothetical protein
MPRNTGFQGCGLLAKTDFDILGEKVCASQSSLKAHLRAGCLSFSDLQDLERTTPNGNFYSVVKGQKDDYWAKKPRQKIPSPDEARRAKKPDFIAHPSERGWYLPTAHPRHFSRFPKEIIDIIFTNVLSMKFPDQLIPRTIERNSVTDFCRPSFEVQSTHSRLSPEETSTLCDDYYSSILWTVSCTSFTESFSIENPTWRCIALESVLQNTLTNQWAWVAKTRLQRRLL